MRDCDHTTKVPALASVQTAEASLDESLTRIRHPFSTAFSTNVLKSSYRIEASVLGRTKAARNQAAL
jgi:hypothetical protein